MLRIASGKAKYLPEDHKLHSNFNFEGINKERYQAFLHSDIYHCKCVDVAALKQLIMFNEV